MGKCTEVGLTQVAGATAWQGQGRWTDRQRCRAGLQLALTAVGCAPQGTGRLGCLNVTAIEHGTIVLSSSTSGRTRQRSRSWPGRQQKSVEAPAQARGAAALIDRFCPLWRTQTRSVQFEHSQDLRAWLQPRGRPGQCPRANAPGASRWLRGWAAPPPVRLRGLQARWGKGGAASKAAGSGRVVEWRCPGRAAILCCRP